MRRRSRRALKIEFRDGKYQPVLLEEHVLREIVERLWLHARIKVWRINQPVQGKTPQNEPGLSDLWGWATKSVTQCVTVPIGQDFAKVQTNTTHAVPLLIEVKRPASPGRRGGVPSPAQIRFIEEARAAGCIAFFADSWKCVVDEMAAAGIAISDRVHPGIVRSGGPGPVATERPELPPPWR